ncbi:MAG: hypothetical protein CMA82_00770 [Euryarchaeota archaeon]|nr:hypothetical protein [Euryarchaeota archaeon]
MEKKKKSMLATDLLITSMFIVIIAPIVITFLLAALIAGFVYLWDGGDTEALHIDSIVSVMIMIHPHLEVNLAILCLFILIGSYFFLLKTRNTSSDNPSKGE